MSVAIRKTLLLTETVLIEGGRPAAVPQRLFTAAAVLKNPWAGLGFVEDLKPAIQEAAPVLGNLLTGMILEAAGSGEAVEAYGKAAIVGLNGEIEHASALIHTLKFGDHFRTAANATTLLPAVEKRGPSGVSFDIPLKHITDATIRSHHQSVEVRIADAPHPGEIVIALAAAAQGRPQQRLAPLSSER